ncbi:hypothetical protein BDV93DRAFT_584137 [Ceratobasidium sp. AG-I]|nr:hypothetical protein BDV93DRAFT_584137 [Ceratobasidium sp. AG-I]
MLPTEVGASGDPWHRPDFKKWATNNAISNALGLYNEEFHRSEDYDPVKRTSRVVEALMSLGQSHLTELRLLKVLADYMVEPFSSVNFWSSFALPPSMVRSGDIGCVKDLDVGNSEWQVLEASGDAEERAATNIDGKERTAYILSIGLGRLITILSVSRWEDVMKRANVLSKEHNIELDKISHVCSVTVVAYVFISHIYKETAPGTSLYFHRHDFACSSPHEFYGFFSASPDPCACHTGLEDLNWRFKYMVEYRTTRINDDWGKQYRQAVRAGLASMPGGYPGLCTEEVSDDEAD